MENHHAINGKTHYKWPFSSSQTVSLPEGCGFAAIYAAMETLERLQKKYGRVADELRTSGILHSSYVTMFMVTILAAN
jgi:hypothetical protein